MQGRSHLSPGFLYFGIYYCNWCDHSYGDSLSPFSGCTHLLAALNYYVHQCVCYIFKLYTVRCYFSVFATNLSLTFLGKCVTLSSRVSWPSCCQQTRFPQLWPPQCPGRLALPRRRGTQNNQTPGKMSVRGVFILLINVVDNLCILLSKLVSILLTKGKCC